jgi:hypothetical protein
MASDLYFKHQCPTQKRADDHQACKKTQTRESEFDRIAFCDVGSNQNLETQKQPATSAYFVLIIRLRVLALMQTKIGRLGDRQQ